MDFQTILQMNRKLYPVWEVLSRGLLPRDALDEILSRKLLPAPVGRVGKLTPAKYSHAAWFWLYGDYVHAGDPR